MKTIALVLGACLSLLLAAPGQACQLAWSANTETDLAGYQIYESLSAGIYGVPKGRVGPDVLTFDCGPEHDSLRHYFSVTALDAANNESVFSNEVSKQFVPPAPASRLRVIGQTATTLTIEASKADCPGGLLTTTLGSTATTLRRVITCKP